MGDNRRINRITRVSSTSKGYVCLWRTVSIKQHRGCLYLRSSAPTSPANLRWTIEDYVAVTYMAYHTFRLTQDIHK